MPDVPPPEPGGGRLAGLPRAIAAVAELVDQSGVCRVPPELVASFGRNSPLVEQQDLAEVVAETGLGLVVRTRDRAGGAGRNSGSVGELGDGRVQPVADDVVATGRVVLEHAPEEVGEICDMHGGPVLLAGAEHDQVARLVAR